VSRFITEKLRVAEHFEKFPVFRRSPPAYLSIALFIVIISSLHIQFPYQRGLQFGVDSESAIRPTVQCFLFVRLRVRITFWELILTDIIPGFTRSLQSNLKFCPSSENPLRGYQIAKSPQPTFFCVSIYWVELQILVMDALLWFFFGPSNPRDIRPIHETPKDRSVCFCTAGGGCGGGDGCGGVGGGGGVMMAVGMLVLVLVLGVVAVAAVLVVVFIIVSKYDDNT